MNEMFAGPTRTARKVSTGALLLLLILSLPELVDEAGWRRIFAALMVAATSAGIVWNVVRLQGQSGSQR